ncbi:ferredoxin [Nocardioides dubius]|uniref:Ferredoxin n=2 Tax=Nocardioides dubius TaxID=317019 RepID=A0ABP4EIU3_9ACTN
MTAEGVAKPRPPRPDVRLDDGPMAPVECSACGACVEVRKSSWDQTSIQWHADALARCEERNNPLPRTERPNRNAFLGCGKLKESVREAAVRGRIEIQDEDPLKINPEGHK